LTMATKVNHATVFKKILFLIGFNLIN